MSAELPDPARASSLDELVTQLRRLKVWAGDPSYEAIKGRVNAAWSAAGRAPAELPGKSTIADCFRLGRRRLDTELVLAIVKILRPDARYVVQWRHALRAISGGVMAPQQVHIHDQLPQNDVGFTGRLNEIGHVVRAVRNGCRVIAISGMAGVGKTQLAVHTGHLLVAQQQFDRVFFVNLRGFDVDPTRSAVASHAVLGGLVRQLGVPGRQIPRDHDELIKLYNNRLTGVRALVVLDNASDTEQVAPLVTVSSTSLTLVTSRRRLTDLPDATQLDLDIFSVRQAEEFLGLAARSVPVGPDSTALSRIARRCGYLPLTLGLAAGYIRRMQGWTLTDHADRLDKRHEDQRLDGAVELALGMSYRHLPVPERRLLRLLALHPGLDFDVYAAAALTGGELSETQRQLDRLHLESLLQTLPAERYTFHDLVRAYAGSRAADEESPSMQREALTRLFDFSVGTAAAMDTLNAAS